MNTSGPVFGGNPSFGGDERKLDDQLLPEELLAGLASRRLRGPIHHLEITASTNDLAKALGAGGAPEGTVVLAEAQSAGRGRHGRQWLSPSGVGLYVSVLLRPPLPPENLPPLTLTAAVAVVRALVRTTGVAPGIKWPNDLMLSGKKFGGILTEWETHPEQGPYLVVGLGINVNTRDFPPELEGLATSLARELGRPIPRGPLLQAWLKEFDGLYDTALRQGFPEILEEWKRHSVTLGNRVTVRQGERQLKGLALEISPTGALLLETAPGQRVWVISGEIPVPG